MQRRGRKGIGKEIVLKAKEESIVEEKSQASYSIEHIQYSDQLAETKVESQSMGKLRQMQAACVCTCVSSEYNARNKRSDSRNEEVKIRCDIRRGKGWR